MVALSWKKIAGVYVFMYFNKYKNKETVKYIKVSCEYMNTNLELCRILRGSQKMLKGSKE